MDERIERLTKRRTKLKADVAHYQEDCKSTNWEIANGSKLFLQKAQEDLETVELALDGLGKQFKAPTP